MHVQLLVRMHCTGRVVQKPHQKASLEPLSGSLALNSYLAVMSRNLSKSHSKYPVLPVVLPIITLVITYQASFRSE